MTDEPLHPAGWSLRGWRGYMQYRADVCGETRPKIAEQFQADADRAQVELDRRAEEDQRMVDLIAGIV